MGRKSGKRHKMKALLYSAMMAAAPLAVADISLGNGETTTATDESTAAEAQQYVQMGYFIGVGGVVTFKNGRKLKEVVEAIPLSNILLETDCPYLAPVPFRGKRNSSEYISYVAEEVARLKGISYEEVLCATEENGKRLFKIK